MSLAALLAGLLHCALAGCSRIQYRQDADAETYAILAGKTQGPNWGAPPFNINAPPQSRNFDPFSPDFSPLPPDDPAAHRYMHCAGGRRGFAFWHDRGDAEAIESPFWKADLPLDDDGRLQLAPDQAVELGLLHSREYQTELEDLYLSALLLTLQRFEFQLQWFGGNSTFYDFLGEQISGRDPPEESNTLSTSTGLGFTRAFTSGGQLLADFANTFVWEFTGANTSSSLSTITASLVQPLVRGAFRQVRMERLTQSERDVLYAARDYARYRKQFYFDVVSGDGGYLSLLLQLQAIRNLEANLESLGYNLRTHEALAAAGVVSPLQVDQVFQSSQAGRLRLIRAEIDLQTALDAYKVQLGLPPELEVELDDSLLQQFELNSQAVNQAQGDVDRLLAEFRELDAAPPRAELSAGFQRLEALHDTIVELWGVVSEEWQQWEKIDAAATETEEDQEEREDTTRDTLRTRLDELRRDLEAMGRSLEGAAAAVASAPPDESWVALQELARGESSHVGALFVIQSQIRAYLIELDAAGFELDQAVEYGLTNRLDLMNTRARVVDAWRKIEVAANALESDVDIVAEGTLATFPGTSNPVNFSSQAASMRAGIRFDAPLNRLAERNIYRAQLIEYQRRRRDFLADRDSIVQAIRRDVRNLRADRLNFEITRQSLIVAARQVELARIQLLAPNQTLDSSATRDYVGALDTLLATKDSLIGVWVSYETNRLQLLLDTEALQLDQQGLPQQDGSLRFDQRQSGPSKSRPESGDAP